MASSKAERSKARAKHIANMIATGQLTLQDRVVHFRTKGMTFARIAKECGISEAHAHRLGRHIPKAQTYHTRTELINLTPHDLFYRSVNEIRRIEKIVFPTMGCLRGELKWMETGDACGMPVFAENHKSFEGISCARKKGRKYIVSRYTAAAYPDREDFFVVHHKPDDMRHPMLGRREENEIDGIIHNPYHKEYILRYSKEQLDK